VTRLLHERFELAASHRVLSHAERDASPLAPIIYRSLAAGLQTLRLIPSALLMKVAAYARYGPPDVVQLIEVEKPTPKHGEVLIRVRATTVNSGDWRVRSLEVPAGFKLLARSFLGFSKPRQSILGTELAGTIEAVGAGVTKFKVGDDVFAFSGVSMGCHAEYKCMLDDGRVVPKPENLSYDEAAALSFGGTTALSYFRRAKLKRGETVLVNGASGAVGVALVQLARHFGADVTAVCSGANAELVRSLGAARVIDYTQDDFTKNGERYDVIVDTAGTAPFSRCRGSLKAGGRLLLILAGLADVLQAPWISLWGDAKVIAGPAAEDASDLRLLAELAGAEKFKPIIDRRYPFDQIVEAHRYVDTGRKRGSVVITLGG
jgi:NADPH:quinone reductase-like Zn-dependent oxidoreductase